MKYKTVGEQVLVTESFGLYVLPIASVAKESYATKTYSSNKLVNKTLFHFIDFQYYTCMPKIYAGIKSYRHKIVTGEYLICLYC